MIACPFCQQPAKKDINWASPVYTCSCVSTPSNDFFYKLDDEENAMVSFSLWITLCEDKDIQFNWSGDKWYVSVIEEDSHWHDLANGDEFLTPDQALQLLKRYKKLLVFS